MLEDQSSRWRAAASPGGLIGLVLTFLSVMAGVAAYLGLSGRAEVPVPDFVLWMFVLAAVLVTLILLYLLWAYLTIGYQLTPGYLRIRWGFWSGDIPITEIDSLMPAGPATSPDRPKWQPIWPGYYVGSRQNAFGKVGVVATLPPRRQVLVRLKDGRQFAISPERPMLFMEEFTRWRGAYDVIDEPADGERRTGTQTVEPFFEAGWTREYDTTGVSEHVSVPESLPEDAQTSRNTMPVQQPPAARVFRSRPSTTSPMLRPALIRDPVAIGLMALGFAAATSMALFILVQYDDIPPSLTLHWNVDGLPGRIGEPREIWILPMIAVLVLAANVGLAWSIALFDRFAARLLLSATIVVHLITWIALIMILR